MQKKKGFSVIGQKKEPINRILNNASDTDSTESSRLPRKTNRELKCLLESSLRIGGNTDDLVARLLEQERHKKKKVK